MVTLGAVKEKEFTLLEPGEYVLTLSEMDEITGQYGDRLVWKFLVADRDDPTAYRCKSNGDEYTLWAFTDPDVVLGSLTHEFAQALSGRALKQGDEPPAEDDLLGKRCLAYVTHYTPKTGKNAGKKQEQIVAGSIKPFKLPASRQAAAPSDTDERIDLIAQIKKEVRKAVMLEVEPAEQWAAIAFDDLSTDELRSGLETIRDVIAQA